MATRGPTKTGESWEDLNKRRGRLAAEARRRMQFIRQQMAREERAARIALDGAGVRVTQALGPRFHVHVARTVLLALRDPTAGMVDAARYCLDDANRWRAMVDVALQELDQV